MWSRHGQEWLWCWRYCCQWWRCEWCYLHWTLILIGFNILGFDVVHQGHPNSTIAYIVAMIFIQVPYTTLLSFDWQRLICSGQGFGTDPTTVQNTINLLPEKHANKHVHSSNVRLAFNGYNMTMQWNMAGLHLGTKAVIWQIWSKDCRLIRSNSLFWREINVCIVDGSTALHLSNPRIHIQNTMTTKVIVQVLG